MSFPAKSHAPPAAVPASRWNAARSAAAPLADVLSLGYMPPVNQMVAIGEVPASSPGSRLISCTGQAATWCNSAWRSIPSSSSRPEYPYTSGTTKVLRDNFAELYAEASALLKLTPKDLVIDIGSNDGTLLSNFKNGGHRVLGIEPTEVGKIANDRGIPTLRATSPRRWRPRWARARPARIVTAANCFAHIEDVHAIVEGILDLLGPDGVFISESHYLLGLLDRLQYDTVYHEHLRYYSLNSLAISCTCTGSRCSTLGRFRPTAARSASMPRGAASSR